MDIDAFRHKSRSVWDAMAAGWNEHRRFVAEAGRPVLDVLVRELAPQPGQTILDVAGGAGEVGLTVAAALGGQARVVVTDFSPQMVEAARGVGAEIGVGNVEYRVLDAEEMALADDSVDGVISRWGYMLMPRPGRALAETRRVLRRGGRLSFAVIADPARNPWAALPSSVLIARGHMAPPAPGTPGIFALQDAAMLERLVREAGFASVSISEVSHAWRCSDAGMYWTFLTDLAGVISTVLTELDEPAREAVRAEVTQRLEPYRTDRGYELPAVSLCVRAE